MSECEFVLFLTQAEQICFEGALWVIECGMAIRNTEAFSSKRS